MRSHRQPRVGITNTARRTSNTVPMAQKTCQREKKQSQDRSALQASFSVTLRGVLSRDSGREKCQGHFKHAPLYGNRLQTFEGGLFKCCGS